MNLKYIDENELKINIKQIFSRYISLDDYKLFIFGSRVKGNNFERSDIDIGILGSKSIPSEIKLEIEEDLEDLPTLYTFDVVDFQDATENFKREALRYIEYLD